MKACRYCGNPVEVPVTTLAYWNQTPCVCHAECKASGEKEEAYECQVIDADCNDCRHYKRGVLAPKVVSNLRKPNGKIVEVSFQPNEIVGGRCLKFDRPTTAYPHQFTGRECFHHRKN